MSKVTHCQVWVFIVVFLLLGLQFCTYRQLLELKLLAFLSGTLHILLFISAYCTNNWWWWWWTLRLILPLHSRREGTWGLLAGKRPWFVFYTLISIRQSTKTFILFILCFICSRLCIFTFCIHCEYLECVYFSCPRAVSICCKMAMVHVDASCLAWNAYVTRTHRQW